MNKLINKFVIGAILLSPSLAFGQTGDPELSKLKKLAGSIKEIIDILIPVVAALALLYFFWGLAKFILNAKDNADAAEQAKTKMLWGLVALFVIVSVWGLVAFIGDSLGIDTDAESVSVPGIEDDSAAR